MLGGSLGAVNLTVQGASGVSVATTTTTTTSSRKAGFGGCSSTEGSRCALAAPCWRLSKKGCCCGCLPPQATVSGVNGTVNLFADGVSTANIYPAAESVDITGAVDGTATSAFYAGGALWIASGGTGSGQKGRVFEGLPKSVSAQQTQPNWGPLSAGAGSPRLYCSSSARIHICVIGPTVQAPAASRR